MITFAEAREAAYKEVAKTWPRKAGVLYALPTGYEDDGAYVVNLGPEEWLVDEDPAYIMADMPMALVSKKNGDVQVTQYLVIMDRVDAMRPVSVG